MSRFVSKETMTKVRNQLWNKKMLNAERVISDLYAETCDIRATEVNELRARNDKLTATIRKLTNDNEILKQEHYSLWSDQACSADEYVCPTAE